MNKEQADIIIQHIRKNTDGVFAPGDFVRFETDKTVGYVPDQLANSFLETGYFDFNTDEKVMTFNELVQGFDAKSQAMQCALSVMLKKKLISLKPSHWNHEEFAIGGDDRLLNPELKIDRAYAYISGFEFDAVSLQIRTMIDSQPKILLQRRGGNVDAADTYDFTAGGGTKYPERLSLESVESQIDHEISSAYKNLAKRAFNSATVFLSHIIKKTSPHGDTIFAVERSRIPLFDVEIDQETAEAITAIKTDEAAGYELASPQEIIEYCANGQISPVMVQSFMASLIATGLMPESDYVPAIKQALIDRGCVFSDEKTVVAKAKLKGLNP